MFGVADYGAFVAAILIFLAIPGPGNLALITSTTKGGIPGGLGATFGVIAGDQVLMWAAVAGVATLLVTYPGAFHAVQWLGAVYLPWLRGEAGGQQVRTQWQRFSVSPTRRVGLARPRRRSTWPPAWRRWASGC